MIELDDGYRIAEISPARLDELVAEGVIDRKSRRQPKLRIWHLFPRRTDRRCAACERRLEGRRTRWCSDECSRAAGRAYAIIDGEGPVIAWALAKIFGAKCAKCGATRVTFEADHIHEVVDGGGGTWLHNFRLLCRPCHVQKTTESRRARKRMMR